MLQNRTIAIIALFVLVALSASVWAETRYLRDSVLNSTGPIWKIDSIAGSAANDSSGSGKFGSSTGTFYIWPGFSNSSGGHSGTPSTSTPLGKGWRTSGGFTGNVIPAGVWNFSIVTNSTTGAGVGRAYFSVWRICPSSNTFLFSFQNSTKDLLTSPGTFATSRHSFSFGGDVNVGDPACGIQVEYWVNVTGGSGASRQLLFRANTSAVNVTWPNPTVACGTIGGNYTATGNITSSGGTCLNMSVPGATLDCNGFSINGPGSGVGVLITAPNTTLRNCVINNFATGLHVQNAQNVIVENDTVNAPTLIDPSLVILNNPPAITNLTQFFNSTVILNGNLTVDNGTLELGNSTLIVNATSNFSSKISIAPNSTFFAHDFDNNPLTTNDASNITATNLAVRYAFIAGGPCCGGILFKLHNSFLSGVGANASIPELRGVFLGPAAAIEVINSTLHDNYVALEPFNAGPGAIIRGNQFVNNDCGAMEAFNFNSSMFEGNVVNQTGAACLGAATFTGTANNHSIRFNNVSNGFMGFILSGGVGNGPHYNNVFANNSFNNMSCAGISTSLDNSTVENNTFNFSSINPLAICGFFSGAIALGMSSNDTVRHNTLLNSSVFTQFTGTSTIDQNLFDGSGSFFGSSISGGTTLIFTRNNLTGPNFFQPLVAVSGWSNGVVANNTIANGQGGILINTGTSNFLVADNNVSVYACGIGTGFTGGPAGSNITIARNRVGPDGGFLFTAGICIDTGTSIAIQNNTVFSNWFGIEDAGPLNTNLTISGNNVSSHVAAGINLLNTNNSHINQNNVTGSGGSGIHLLSSSNNSGGANNVSFGGVGVLLEGSSLNNFTLDVVSNAESAGISLEASSNNNIFLEESVKSVSPGPAFRVLGSNGNVFDPSFLNNSVQGALISNASGTTINSTIIFNNSMQGVFVTGSNNTVLCSNSITFNGLQGVYINQSINTTICGDSLIGFNGAAGIYNFNSSGTIVGFNTVSFNNHSGIINDRASNFSDVFNFVQFNGWDGISNFFNSSGNITFNFMIANNTLDGVLVRTDYNPITIDDNTIQNNGKHGVTSIDAIPTVDYADLGNNTQGHILWGWLKQVNVVALNGSPVSGASINVTDNASGFSAPASFNFSHYDVLEPCLTTDGSGVSSDCGLTWSGQFVVHENLTHNNLSTTFFTPHRFIVQSSAGANVTTEVLNQTLNNTLVANPCEYIGFGDWVITTLCIFTNRTFNVTGNLNITGTGNLTLIGGDLNVVGGLSIATNGSLNIINQTNSTTIHSAAFIVPPSCPTGFEPAAVPSCCFGGPPLGVICPATVIADGLCCSAIPEVLAPPKHFSLATRASPAHFSPLPNFSQAMHLQAEPDPVVIGPTTVFGGVFARNSKVSFLGGLTIGTGGGFVMNGGKAAFSSPTGIAVLQAPGSAFAAFDSRGSININGTWTGNATVLWSNDTVHFNVTSDGEFGLDENNSTIIIANDTIVTNGDANASASYFFRTSGSAVTIDNSTISHAGFASFSLPNRGLYLENAFAPNITRSKFVNITVNAIVMKDSQQANITGNNLTGEQSGFGFGVALNINVTNSTIANNILHDVANGIGLGTSCHNNTVSGNTCTNVSVFCISSSTVNNVLVLSNNASSLFAAAIQLDGNNSIIQNNTATGPTGIVSSGSNNTVASNTIQNAGLGINLFAQSSSSVRFNVITNTTTGISATNAQFTSITNNTINPPVGTGIELIISNNNNLQNNTILSPSIVGIKLSAFGVFNTSNNTLQNNTVLSGSGTGINLSNASNNTLVGNNASLNSFGITLDPSNNNTFSSNFVCSNTQDFNCTSSTTIDLGSNACSTSNCAINCTTCAIVPTPTPTPTPTPPPIGTPGVPTTGPAVGISALGACTSSPVTIHAINVTNSAPAIGASIQITFSSIPIASGVTDSNGDFVFTPTTTGTYIASVMYNGALATTYSFAVGICPTVSPTPTAAPTPTPPVPTLPPVPTIPPQVSPVPIPAGIGEACTTNEQCSTKLCDTTTNKCACSISTCETDSQCCSGYCSPVRHVCLTPPTPLSVYGVRPACAGLISIVTSYGVFALCDLLWLILIALSLFAAWLSRKEPYPENPEYRKWVPLALFLLPIVTGLFTLVILGILVALIEIAAVLIEGRVKHKKEQKPAQAMTGPQPQTETQ